MGLLERVCVTPHLIWGPPPFPVPCIAWSCFVLRRLTTLTTRVAPGRPDLHKALKILPGPGKGKHEAQIVGMEQYWDTPPTSCWCLPKRGLFLLTSPINAERMSSIFAGSKCAELSERTSAREILRQPTGSKCSLDLHPPRSPPPAPSRAVGMGEKEGDQEDWVLISEALAAARMGRIT